MVKRRRHEPQRTCVGCRQVAAKRSMTRIVRTPDGEVQIDLSGKLSGRGAYLCDNPACWEAALKGGSLARALKTQLSSEEREMLAAHIMELAGTAIETGNGAG